MFSENLFYKHFPILIRKMMYENDEEMNKVIGNLDENVFIKQQQAELKKLKMTVKLITKTFKL